MRTANPSDPKGPFLYSTPIGIPKIEDTDFLFGAKPAALKSPPSQAGSQGK